MFKVISESYIGEVQGIFKGDKTSKGKFPIIGTLYTNTTATLKKYDAEEDRDADFLRLKDSMRNHIKYDLCIDFENNEFHYF